MRRTDPIALREALERAQKLADAGVDFVPMPVINQKQKDILNAVFNIQIEKIMEYCDEE